MSRPTTEQSASQPVVEVRSVTKRHAHTTVLNGISHAFERGRVSVICRPSGFAREKHPSSLHPRA